MKESSYGSNHYFYEIVNRTTTDVAIQLSYSSRNVNEEQRSILNRINELSSRKQAKEDWYWWIGYKTDKIPLPDDLDKDVIFERLDAAFDNILTFEKDLMSKLNMNGA